MHSLIYRILANNDLVSTPIIKTTSHIEIRYIPKPSPMYRVTIIDKGDRPSVIAYNTPEPFRKGANFEKYTRDNVFTGAHFKMIHKPFSNTDIQHDITESFLKPAFRFRDKQTGTEFYLETKFRTSLYLDKIEWTYPDQLTCYQECQQGNSGVHLIRTWQCAGKSLPVIFDAARKSEDYRCIPLGCKEI